MTDTWRVLGASVMGTAHVRAELPCQEIAARMVSQTPDVTRLVDRLESAGLVARSRTQVDRRLVLVRITPAGVDLLAGLDAPVLDLHRRQMAHMDPDELAECCDRVGIVAGGRVARWIDTRELAVDAVRARIVEAATAA